MRNPLLISSAFIATALAVCDRTFLNDFTALYLSAQTRGNSSLLTTQLLQKNFTYTEQFQPANISSPTSILQKPLNVTTYRSFLDPKLCTSFTEIIVTDPTHPYVIGVRAEGDGKVVYKIETLVSDAGDWLFNATGTAYYNSREKWDPIPVADQDTRETIQAAGDAYFNRFGNANVTVPFGTPCARLEGGAYTDASFSNASTCHLGLPSTINVVDRRYVVDVEMGAVNIYVGFPGLDRASKTPAPDSHTFRVEKGKIRYIHTISTCEGHPGCGLNGTYVPIEGGGQ
ncbi:Nn.00g080620.m01.CDS01 [Neocucurbitaria sp. VM-36]